MLRLRSDFQLGGRSRILSGRTWVWRVILEHSNREVLAAEVRERWSLAGRLSSSLEVDPARRTNVQGS